MRCCLQPKLLKKAFFSSWIESGLAAAVIFNSINNVKCEKTIIHFKIYFKIYDARKHCC